MRLSRDFFERDALEVAPDLLGKALVSHLPGLPQRRLIISETEVYRGEEDTACHAHRGRTRRTEPLYMAGGHFYIYLCYGIHWLLNAVTGPAGRPQGVLIRACRGYEGPGRLTNTWVSRESSTVPGWTSAPTSGLRTRAEWLT